MNLFRVFSLGKKEGVLDTNSVIVITFYITMQNDCANLHIIKEKETAPLQSHDASNAAAMMTDKSLQADL
jgi:hypothetical protein